MLTSPFLRFTRFDYFCLLAAASVVLVKGGAEIFFGMSALLGIWFCVKEPIHPFSNGARAIAVVMGSFLALKLLSVAWAPDRWAAIRDFGTHGHWLALLPLIIFFRQVPNVGYAFLNGLGLSMVICAAWALFLHPDITQWGPGTRFQASTGNALILGAFATVCASLFCTLLFSTKSSAGLIKKWHAWAFYFASVFVVVASWSRMPMITIVVLNFLALFSFVVFWKGNVRVTLVAGLLILGSVGLLVEHTSLGNRFRTAAQEVDRFNEQADQTTPVGIRMAMQQSAVEAIKKAPLFGSGAGSAMKVTKESAQVLFGENSSIVGFRHLHNQYLQVAVEQGLVGLGLFIWVGYLAIRFFWKSKDFFVHQAGIFLVLSYALLGLTNISIKQGALNSFFVLMLAMLLVMAERRDGGLQGRSPTDIEKG
jgi:O-antigen ligase